MEYKFSKFPVQKSYIKVQSNGNSSQGSVESPDDLSYSYSCIKAFGKNRSIIENLTSLHVNDIFQGEGHEPLLYSLSGDREKPICGPFYYSNSPTEAKNKNCYSAEKFIKIEDPRSSNLESEYEPIFSDKSALFDWLKDQVKYFNVLWSFSKSSYINLAKFCKCKNQDVKMEMLLNNIDEKTKTRLKRYLNELNLDLEERCTLFNESTIEIDITPILADKSKFQAFLNFLKTIDPSVYNTMEGNVKHPLSQLPKRTENQTSNKYIIPTKETKECKSLKERNGQLWKSSADRISRQISGLPENKDELSKDWMAKPKPTEIYGLNLSKNDKETSQNHEVRTNCPSNFAQENSLKALFDSGNMNRQPINNHQLLSNNDKFSRKPRARFESTLAAKQRSFNSSIERKQANRMLSDLIPDAEGKSKVSDTNCAQTDRNLSCKCLIHLRREDYNRYRNQCLFGKGDETSINFVKDLSDKERELQSQNHICSQNEGNENRAWEMKRGKDRPFNEFEDEYFNELRKNQKLKNDIDNKTAKRTDVENNKLKQAAEKEYNSKSCQKNYRTSEKIRVGDDEKLMYSINYNDNSYYNDYDTGFDNNLGLLRGKPTKMKIAEEEPSSFDACFESLNYDAAKLKRSANLTCEKSKSDTHTAPSKFVTVKYDHMETETEPMEKMKKEVNKDHWHRCHSIKHSEGSIKHSEGIGFQTRHNIRLNNDKHPSLQVLHSNNRLQNCYDNNLKPDNYYSSDNHAMFNDGINQSNYKVLPMNKNHEKIKKGTSLQSLDSSHSYASERKADIHSFQTNCSRVGLLDKINLVVKINKTNNGEAKPQLKEIKSHKTHLSLNSLKPKNLYRNISTVLKRKSSNRSKSEETKVNYSECVQSFSEEKFKCKIKGVVEPTQNSKLKYNNSCNSVSERELPLSESSEPQPEIPSLLTELLERLVTELQNQRKEINEIKKLFNDKKLQE